MGLRVAVATAAVCAAVSAAGIADAIKEMHADPEIFVGYSTKEVGYIVTEEMGRLIKSLESRPSNAPFTMAVSGGSLPRFLAAGLHEHARDFVSAGAGPGNTAVEGADVLSANWKRVKAFYADERIVPHTSAHSNHGTLKEKLWDKLPVEKHMVYAVNSDLSPERAAATYEKKIRDHVTNLNADGIPVFDLIILGMGPDGHTASLFPNHELLKERTKLVAPITDSPKPPEERVTLTLPIINAAKNVWFVVTGSSKVTAVMDALSGKSRLPAALVAPTDGRRVWFLDAEAAAELKTKFLAAHRPKPHPKRRHFNGVHEDL